MAFLFKEFAELVHKVHLLCLLARGRLVDNACNDPLIQVFTFVHHLDLMYIMPTLVEYLTLSSTEIAVVIY